MDAGGGGLFPRFFSQGDSIAVARPVTEKGAEINARMGLNTWAAFVGSDQNAAVAGDVAMLENEVTPVRGSS